MNDNNAYCEFMQKICSMTTTLANSYPFNYGNVRLLEINGMFAFLWLTPKGEVGYSFDLSIPKSHTTSVSKLSDALSSHFRCLIEAVNNIDNKYKKQHKVVSGVAKAITDLQSYEELSSYNQNKFDELPMNSNNDLYTAPLQTQQNNFQSVGYDQKQMYTEIISLSVFQLEHNKNTYFIHLNELPMVYKEEFNPFCHASFFIDEYGYNTKNKYVSSKLTMEYQAHFNIENSFILSFLSEMAKNDPVQLMNIFVWLVLACTQSSKSPYVLVVFSETNKYLELFYEEIVMPLANENFCEKIMNNHLSEKILSTKLDEKIVYNFSNVTSPEILNYPSKELTNKLIYKDTWKFDSKVITTKGNILVTSTSSYIPTLSKETPALLVKAESNLENLCKMYNIVPNQYEVARLIQSDLKNFLAIVRHINIATLIQPCNVALYKGNIEGIIDGDEDIVTVFNYAFIYKDITFFESLKKTHPRLFYTLIRDFDENRVNRAKLIEYFVALYGETIYKKNQSKKLIADLRELSSTIEPFENEKTHPSHGNVYFELK